ncbi:MAG: glycosyltransferase family 4 protein [Deltaproteobacteria bacterium]|nr:glycosyltransferase family 4 protein [Deltaproteobacteria bacterium]
MKRIAIVLDNKINRWALQRFEPLKDVMDITVFVGEKNDYDVKSIDLNKRQLTHAEEIILVLKDPLTAYRRIIKAPYKKMDFYYFSLKKYLKGMDMVYSCDISRSAYTLASLKDELGFKFILSWWENIPFRAVFDEKTAFHKRLVMDKVDLFLPFTKMAKEVLKLEGVPEEKIEVIYPGVDMERFKPGKKPEHLLAKNNIPVNSFVILYVGKLVSWKGVHNLVYAARILKQRGVRDFVVAVAGKGAQKENMEKLIKESGTEDNFRFLDFISYDEMPEVYRMADVFALPSYPTMTWQEQFGMVLIETMASGKPIISTMSGGIPEVIGDAGILIPSGDYFQLAENIHKLIKDDNLRGALGRKAMERAGGLYDARKNGMQFESILENRL